MRWDVCTCALSASECRCNQLSSPEHCDLMSMHECLQCCISAVVRACLLVASVLLWSPPAVVSMREEYLQFDSCCRISGCERRGSTIFDATSELHGAGDVAL